MESPRILERGLEIASTVYQSGGYAGQRMRAPQQLILLEEQVVAHVMRHDPRERDGVIGVLE